MLLNFESVFLKSFDNLDFLKKEHTHTEKINLILTRHSISPGPDIHINGATNNKFI